MAHNKLIREGAILGRAICVLIILFFSSVSHAITAEQYFKSQESAREGSSLDEMFLNGYHLGLAESFFTLALMNNSDDGLRVLVPPVMNICPPSQAAISVNSIESAIQLRIGNYESPNVPKNHKNTPVGVHAFFGLFMLFPCK